MSVILKQLLLFIFIFLLSNRWTHAQSFENMDFDKICIESKTGLCAWDLSWGAPGSCRPDSAENNQFLLISGKSEKSVGFVEQSLNMSPTKDIQILSVSAEISSDGIQGKGAGLNIGAYDEEGVLLSTLDMGGFYGVSWIKGTTPWSTYSREMIIPVATATIKIGAILYGHGKAKFDNYKVNFSLLNDRQPSKLAEAYITEAIEIISENSLVRDSLNLNDLKINALKIAGPATKSSECHLAIKYLLESLRPVGDHHSFLMTPEELAAWKNNEDPEGELDFASFDIVNQCAYINVPGFHHGNNALIKAFADSLQAAIEYLSNQHIKGWIVDLRNNTGGNMEPMIAGLGPLFSEKKLGALIDINGEKDHWYYDDGHYYWDNEDGINIPRPVRLKQSLPIAVLTSSTTGSSGEIVVISFKGEPNTKFFGQPTWGLTTGNGEFDLSDGARMMLASTIMSDRNGILYTAPIQPDIIIDKSGIEQDEVLDSAIKWVLEYGK